MSGHSVRAELTLPVARAEVFRFFADATNLERITPPDLRFSILQAPPVIGAGSLIDYRLRLDGIPFRWRTRIAEWKPEESFVDEQIRGPYRLWVHRHEFEAIEAGVTRIRDRVDLVLPLGALGAMAWPYVRTKLTRIFLFRQRAVATAFANAHAECRAMVWIDEAEVALGE